MARIEKPNRQLKTQASRIRRSRTRRSAPEITWRPAIVLVPTDFSYAADRALRYAVQLTRRQRSRLALLHVVAPAAIPGLFLPSVRLDLPQLVKSSKEHLARLAQRMGIRPRLSAVKTGHAAEAILRFADETGADLIVIGARGHSTLDRLLIGTTAERVVRQARCPVLVVPLPGITATAKPVSHQ